MNEFDFDELSESVTSDTDSSSDWEPETAKNKKKSLIGGKSKAATVVNCPNYDDDLALYDDTDTELPNQDEIGEERDAVKPVQK